MSFGGGFGGFGQSNTQQSSGFGGFGANKTNTTSTGFGSTGFGSNTNSSTGGNFGSGGGFGAASSNTFGSGTSSGFGSTSNTATTGGGGLFASGGGTTSGSTGGGFGGFGSTSNTNTTSGFGGGGSTGGSTGLFGSQSKTSGFGASGTTGGSIFGGGSGTTGQSGGTFGAASSGGGAFGAPATALSGNIGDPPGTATAPFNALTEKEPNQNTTNSFQNILFQDAYRKWSSDELRLVDYNQGRRHGNAAGGGAFGVGTGFGGSGGFGASSTTATQGSTGFGAGSSSGGLFGSGSASTGTGFGASATTASTGAFGAGGTGGLFGQKTQTTTGGGMFGGGAAQTGSTGTFGAGSGSAFGGGGTTGGSGFGATNASTGTGGGLFGTSGATQNKPAGFGFGGGSSTTGAFGSGAASSTTGTGFGATASTTTGGGGLFGSGGQQQSTTSTGGGLFGNTQQTQQTGGAFGSAFGAQQQQQQATGGGMFGNAQQKPGGLFGAQASTGTTATGGSSLFGGGAASGGTGFGTGAAQQTGGGGLFGNKPAATGATGGLFGASPAQNTGATGGGVFGGGLGQNQTQQQQSGGGGLFGSSQQAQAKPSSIFGGSTTQQTGNAFGAQPAAQAGGSMFGNSSQQQQSTGLGNSIFGGSQNVQGSQGQSLTTNINDATAYGTSSLFSNLGGNDVRDPGPLATPLSNQNKPRRSSILPMYKLNPASASRLSTPQKRGGFGFSYSTYGTPGSASSVSSTPGGLGQSLLLGNSSRSLNKSISTNSLRRSFNTEDSILTPGAFSANGVQRFGSVSKKLVINREMRSDLFATPQKDKVTDSARGSRLRKHVSFEDVGNSDTDATPIPAPAVDAPLMIQNTASNGTPSRSPQEAADTPRAPQVNVPSSSPKLGGDLQPGQYWMEPTVQDVLNMSRDQRSAVRDFTVGRANVGSVKFLHDVDLTNIDVENLFRDTIDLEPRSATVYKVPSKKPPVGKGLNVPAQISLEQSWPRGKERKANASSDLKLKKHVDRLRRIPDTTFISYNKDTGVWAFRVEHFTTYGLDYDSDDSDAEADVTENETGFSNNHASNPSTEYITEQVASPNFDDDDDTFDFRRKRALPGAFDNFDDYEPEAPAAVSLSHGAEEPSSKQSFLCRSSVGSFSNEVVPVPTQNEVDMDEEYEVAQDEETATSSPGNHLAAEPYFSSPDRDHVSDVPLETPGGIMRARMRAIKDSTVPTNVRIADGDDWTDMLQRTISPQKRDRALLKSLNAAENYDSLKMSMRDNPPHPRRRVVSDGRGFATSIDLMNSLFGKPKAPVQEMPAPSRGFVKWPYERQTMPCNEDMTPRDRAFHRSMRPSWGPTGTVVFATIPRSLGRSSYRSMEKGGILSVARGVVSSEHREIRLGKFSNELSASALQEQMRFTRFNTDAQGIPAATLTGFSTIKSLFHDQNPQNAASAHEKLVWELASVLFDDLDIPMNLEAVAGIGTRFRRQNVSRFWQTLVDEAATRCVTMAKSSEEKAIACLSARRIPDACKHLVGAKNFHLATLIATIGTSDSAKSDMQEQLQRWSDNKFLSEFTEPIRALYSLLSGEVHQCAGNDIGPVEDRLSQFLISQQFGLDWKQAFGLRLWYAIAVKDDVAVAVRKFSDDLMKGEMKPKTWYSEQGIAPIWEDSRLDGREDLLWGLLKLYADANTDLEAVLRPENSQLSPLDFRLTWQLGLALAASGKVGFGLRRNEKADSATISFASQLVNEGSWLEATFVLLHLSNAEVRAQAIKEHLARHAGSIGDGQSDDFVSLTQNLKIPAAWVWNAKALYMRAVKRDAICEVQCLLKAGAFNDAHQTFVEKVAPKAVIETDYAALENLLMQFAGHEARIPEWRLGGEVYGDFVRLVGTRGRMDTEDIERELVDRLLNGLPALHEQAMGSGVEHLAAVAEMGGVVAKVVVEMEKRGQANDLSRVLGLPLTEDGYLKHSMDLSMAYYKELMAGGR